MSDLSVSAALKAHTPYPLSEDFVASILLKRGLSGEERCTPELLSSASFTGAQADCLQHLLIYPNSIAEGGMSLSKADREAIAQQAHRLYHSIGEDCNIQQRPRITFY